MTDWPTKPSEKMIRRAACIVAPFLQNGQITKIGELTTAIARELENDRVSWLKAAIAEFEKKCQM
jgi:hypothetical protein